MREWPLARPRITLRSIRATSKNILNLVPFGTLPIRLFFVFFPLPVVLERNHIRTRFLLNEMLNGSFVKSHSTA